MKHDIRNLFQEDEPTKQLPENHRAEFLEKLKHSESKKEKQKRFNWFKIAAVFVIALGISFLFLKGNSKIEKPQKLEIVQQIEKVEQEYLQNIDKEWQQFLQLAEDDNLVKRYEQKLADLDTNYRTISKQFKAEPNNILVIEDLVNNLKTRLQLLKDIQAHIKFIKKESEPNENTI